MNKLKKLCNHVKEYGLVKTIKWVYKYIALKINHLSVKNIDFVDVENDNDSKEFGYLKELPNIFIVASIPYYDIGAGQRCSQLAKTFNKMGYNVNYLYAYKSSENTKFSIEMPMSSHIFIDDKIIDNIKDKVHENDLFIFESPCNKFSKVLDYAINSKVKLIILPLNINLDNKVIKKAEKNGVNIIASEYDSFQIATKISLSNYIKNININKNPVTVNNEDYFSDFKSMIHKINHTNYPVINNKKECLGLIRLTGPNDYEKQKVILVDHNNLAQSVDGIEEANILEIIDHHNLGAIGTNVPINFRSRPVGCTSTMIYDMFIENKINIPKEIGGLMLSAILSDTLLLTSPTTTEDDRFAAVKLASIAKVDMDKYGLEMIKAASSIEGMSVRDLIKSDFKNYVVGSKNLGIGQVMTLDFDRIKENMDEYVNVLNEMADTNYSVVVIFITDIIKNGSYVIYNSEASEVIEDAFGLKDVYEGVFLPKMVSRKKQILPNILSVMEDKK